MKRIVAIGLLVLAVLVVLVVGTGASNDGGGAYRVRAIFDNAGYVVPGEDVKMAGAKVGTVQSLDVTKDKKAAVVLDITDPAFQDFKQDASCTVRPQSLIGENFVECQPTAPKGANATPAPPLRRIASGPGKGQYLLPVDRTSSPVGVDLIGDVMRLPERQRFALILNELGTGLAGNGDELRRVVRRADPALEQTDRALNILAKQNTVLADLARDSDTDLAPLAREKGRLADFIDKAGQTATATAQRGDALEQNFQRLPAFLAQLRPTAQRLSQFADQATPVFDDLRAAAPSINQLFAQLGPFSTAALPALRTLGQAADVGSQALPAAQPVLTDVTQLASASNPVLTQLAAGLQSFQKNYGYRRVMDFIVNTVGTMNGFDSVSHFLRATLYVGLCQIYSTTNDTCNSTFRPAGASAASVASTASAQQPTATTPTTPATPPTSTAPQQQQQPQQPTEPSGSTGTSGGTARPVARTGMLDYLLGGSTR